MNKNDAMLLAQLIRTMNDLMKKFEDAYNSKDMEKLEAIKKEMMGLQKKIDLMI